MRISESCAACLYDKQAAKSDNQEYLAKVKKLLAERKETDTSPYMVYLFTKLYREMFGEFTSYADVKKQYNDLVLSMEDVLREKIESAGDPFAQALLFSRIGNYIDFGAMNHVDQDTFLALFDHPVFSEKDAETMIAFLAQCAQAKTFLLLTDNCGEVVLDKLFLEQLHKKFPQLQITAMVRGGEVLNDATMEDALYVGLDKVARVVDNGMTIAGTVYEYLPEEGRKLMDESDIVMAKGQGNYETLCAQGRHIFYSFLCKCDLFTTKFGVPKLTGMFVEDFGK